MEKVEEEEVEKVEEEVNEVVEEREREARGGDRRGEEGEWVRGWQKGEEGRQRTRKRAIDSNVGDILRRRDREQ